MYNPLQELSEAALNALIGRGYMYFVRQSYPRGIKPGGKEAFIITPYKEVTKAQDHYIAIKDDKRKYLYNINHQNGDYLSRDFDRERLYMAAKQPKGYSIYLDRLKDQKWTVPGWLKVQIHEGSKRLGWGSRNMDVQSDICLRHGQLFVKFTNKGHTEYIPLDELEKY
jgi:hypothetical protein